MNNNNEKKQIATIWILTILIIVLIAMIAGLIVKVMISKEQSNTDTEQRLAQLQQELEQVKAQTSKIEKTETTANSENADRKEINNNTQTKNTASDEILTPNQVLQKLGRNENNQYLSNNFCIDGIEEVEDGYVITAYLLKEKAREVSEEELQSVKNGNEIEFRNKKWKISNSDSTMYDPSIVIENEEKSITIGNQEGGSTFYFQNIAGEVAKLHDYTGEKIKFKVKKDILICTSWYYFTYDDDGKMHEFIHGEGDECIPMKLCSMDELKNIIKKNTR